MDAASPTKRRALASLNANALPSPRTAAKQQGVKPVVFSPVKENRKRPLETAVAPIPSPLKKACREDVARERSESPCSSVFDAEAGECSWANTTATEPDTSPAPRAMTREQAREKAEILRLRLGLASYKFRTGQTTIPLANLQRKPIPSRITRQKEESQGSQNTEEERDAGREQETRVEEEEGDAAMSVEAASTRQSSASPSKQAGIRVPESGRLVSSAAAAAKLLGLVKGPLDP